MRQITEIIKGWFLPEKETPPSVPEPTGAQPTLKEFVANMRPGTSDVQYVRWDGQVIPAKLTKSKTGILTVKESYLDRTYIATDTGDVDSRNGKYLPKERWFI